jgi:hypothetical protein
VIVWALPPGCVRARHSQSSESDVVHDHIRLRQYQIAAIACMGVRVRTRHVEHAGTTASAEAVGGSSCGGQLSPGRSSTEMISDGCTYANRKVLIKCVGENLLPTAHAWFGGRAFRWRLQTPETVISTCRATSFQVTPLSRSSRICWVEAGRAGGPPRRILMPAL